MFVPKRRIVWPVGFFLIFVILLISHQANVSRPSMPPKRASDEGMRFMVSDEMKTFWADLLLHLRLHDPGIPPLVPIGKPSLEQMDPNTPFEGERTYPDILEISDADLSTLNTSHTSFIKVAGNMAPRFPYRKGTRGIVVNGGGAYLGTAILSIFLTRRSGTTLPIQLFLDKQDDYSDYLCRYFMADLGVECLYMDAMHGTDDIKKYQYKVFSIIFSSFQHVLYLDADAWPIHDPEVLFDSKPYTNHGLVTWPDFWLPTVAPIFYRMTGLEQPDPPTRMTSEASILLYNKEVHADSLLLAAYYNWYGPTHFYTMFSQGAHGEGDKETFLHAALALGKPFYDVKSDTQILGRWFDETYEPTGMRQLDPMEDYKLYEYKKRKGRAKKGAEARTFFIHHNQMKLDLWGVAQPDSPLFTVDDQGNFTRLWGSCEDLNRQSGFDVERAMWEVVVDLNCRWTSMDDCKELRAYFDEVFPPITKGWWWTK